MLLLLHFLFHLIQNVLNLVGFRCEYRKFPLALLLLSYFLLHYVLDVDEFLNQRVLPELRERGGLVEHLIPLPLLLRHLAKVIFLNLCLFWITFEGVLAEKEWAI